MFTLDDDLLRQLRDTFKLEAAEHLQAMNRVLLALEENPPDDERAPLMQEIFREAHSLKGAAGAADLPEVEAMAHQLENVFSAAKNGKITLSRDRCDVLYAGIDAVSVIVDAALAGKSHGLDLPGLYDRLAAVEQGRATADTHAAESPREQIVRAAELPPSTAAEPKKPATLNPAAEETIRVATSKIDALMAQSGELLVAGLKIDQRLNEVEKLSHALEEWNREWRQAKTTSSDLLRPGQHAALRPGVTSLDGSHEKLRELSLRVNELRRGFARDALQLSRLTQDLGEGVMKVRMLPVSTVFDAFPRLVRDVARERNKEVELKMEGAETELDRKVLEQVKDPLIHLLRNGVDHGIEPPEDRVKVGKPRHGTITVRTFQKGNNIVIQVADDGGGIDCAKVKQAALKNALMSANELQALSDDETLRLIFVPGLSTRATITDISGRGVGMDVVRKNVDALQGQVEVESTLGEGTTITLTLPLTLATTQELLVQVGDQIYGIPISAVERIQRVGLNEIGNVCGKPAIVVGDEPVSLARLSQVLELPNAEPPAGVKEKIPVVVLGTSKRRIGFIVDAVIGQQETVVKGLGKQLARVRNVTGATILGSGRVILMLNPADLLKAARGIDLASRNTPVPSRGKGTRNDSPAKAKPAKILVVDDSLSTRSLEKNILETAGYSVVVAADGLEALNILRSNGGCDLVISDILMPNLDGLALTSTIRQDVNLKKIPVVLVTLLESRADKERGIEVGADAYLVKSDFDQTALLETVAQLV